MTALSLRRRNDDDPALLFRLQHIISGAIRYGRPRHTHVVKIDNWFGKRWLCFAGTRGDEELRSETRLAVPPFAPNRVVAETTYLRRGNELSRIEVRPLHAEPPSRDPVYLEERVHSGVFVWYSGRTAEQDRCALMVYDVERGGEQRAWYAELHERGGTWTVASAVGTSVSEIEGLETSYADRLAPLSMHPADREHENDRRLWEKALAATYGPGVAKAGVLIRKYKARYPDNPGIRLLHARNLGERRLFGAAEAEFRASERYDAVCERWRVVWLREWVDFCELRRDEGRAEGAHRELVRHEPNHTGEWIPARRLPGTPGQAGRSARGPSSRDRTSRRS